MSWGVNQRVEPCVVPGCITGSGDLGPYLKSVTIRRPYGGKNTFDATFFQADPSSHLATTPAGINPFPNGGTFGVLPHNFTYQTTNPPLTPPLNIPPPTFSRKVNFTFLVAPEDDGSGGVLWTSPTFMPNAPSFDGEVLHWSGEDLTALLDLENQKLTDIIADQPKPMLRMAHEVLAEQCTKGGIKQIICNFPDYKIRLLRRTGNLASMNAAVYKIYQAFPTMRGDVLHFEAAGTTRGDTWSFVDQLNIHLAEPKINDSIKNRFTITRLEPQPMIIGEAQCSGPQCLGRTIDIVLDPPSNNVQVHVEGDMTHASIIDYAFFKEGDKPGKISSGRTEDNALPAPGAGGKYNGNPPAAHLKATYLEALNPDDPGGDIFGGNAGSLSQVTWNPNYHITVYGGGPAPGFDTKYSFAQTDSSGTTMLIGIHEEFSNIEDPIIPSTQVAKDYLAAMLYENARKVWEMEAHSYYFNPMINPGDTVIITDYLTAQSGVAWFVQEIRLVYNAPTSIGSAPDFHIEMSLTRGPL